MTAPDPAEGFTFDLTTKQGAADAAAHLISLTGERIVVVGASGRPVRTRADGVHVWRDGDGTFALSVNVWSMPYEFHGGTITIALDTGPEELPRWRRDLLEIIRRPIHFDTEEA